MKSWQWGIYWQWNIHFYLGQKIRKSSSVFVANWTSVQVLDVSDPMDIQYITSTSTPGNDGDLAVLGQYILATSSTNGLEIYKFDPDSQSLSLVTTYHYPNVEFRCVDVSGSYAYISCRYGLEVVDISDITNPQHGIYISKGSLNKDVVAGGGWAFIAGAFQGIHIFDLRDWFSSGGPVETYTMAYNPDNTRNSYDIAVDGAILYCADYYNGLEIFDWMEYVEGGTDWWIGECKKLPTRYPMGVAVDGTWAYLTTTEYGYSSGALYVIDVSDIYFGMPFDAYSTNEDGGYQPYAYDDWVAFVSFQYASSSHPTSTMRMEELLVPPYEEGPYYFDPV